MTISEFHNQRINKIQYTRSDSVMVTTEDFYNEFLIKGKRLPKPKSVQKWHDLLVRYIKDPTAKTFLIRKYESKKENGKWDNRRGSIVRFSDGFEVVYASNFLAHEIFMMAYYDFVPDYEDFKGAIENRTLPITSGTEVEKNIRSYFVSSNKTIDCYFAHIMDVNGKYLRTDPYNTYSSLSFDEIIKMYPVGKLENWCSSPDKVYHISYDLNIEEKELVKAHFLRFLDPMNYFLTPQTKHCKHKIGHFTKNIGEYEYLRCFVQKLYSNEFKEKYIEFAKLARFCEEIPEDYTGKEKINLEYSTDYNNDSKEKGACCEDAGKGNKLVPLWDFINYMPPEKRNTAISYCSSLRKVMAEADIADLDALKENIQLPIDYCEHKMKEAKLSEDNKMEKKYSNIRSAINKYKEYLESNKF